MSRISTAQRLRLVRRTWGRRAAAAKTATDAAWATAETRASDTLIPSGLICASQRPSFELLPPTRDQFRRRGLDQVIDDDAAPAELVARAREQLERATRPTLGLLRRC